MQAITGNEDCYCDSENFLYSGRERIKEIFMSAYDHKRIAAELTATALGQAHFGNALRVAKDIPGITPEDRSVLDRFATGTNSASDGHHLQDISNKIAANAI